ncbi:hypothetical protein H0H81_005240 [Sphagnurus paluster]|uniref:Uncharacterized protein n=1 Tax=Sphagnurus paluster TaxID=117069 RepID=A0A9P7FRY4_9AGAR|nr:hypothetical protein H0H81_005240 [Sphagnurus paluster]
MSNNPFSPLYIPTSPPRSYGSPCLYHQTHSPLTSYYLPVYSPWPQHLSPHAYNRLSPLSSMQICMMEESEDMYQEEYASEEEQQTQQRAGTSHYVSPGVSRYASPAPGTPVWPIFAHTASAFALLPPAKVRMAEREAEKEWFKGATDPGTFDGTRTKFAECRTCAKAWIRVQDNWSKSKVAIAVMALGLNSGPRFNR